MGGAASKKRLSPGNDSRQTQPISCHLSSHYECVNGAGVSHDPYKLFSCPMHWALCLLQVCSTPPPPMALMHTTLPIKANGGWQLGIGRTCLEILSFFVSLSSPLTFSVFLLFLSSPCLNFRRQKEKSVHRYDENKWPARATHYYCEHEGVRLYFHNGWNFGVMWPAQGDFEITQHNQISLKYFSC